MNFQTEISQALAGVDYQKLQAEFQAQNEFLVLENFVPNSVLNEFLSFLPSLQPAINRNYIPNHKKGGSISRYSLDNLAPIFGEFYQLNAFFEFLNRITGEKLLPCPDRDPHTYALYYYTEPGDHIQYHYDTSYYQGKRYTVLLGLVDRSSSKLEYQLYKDIPDRETQVRSLSLKPGTLVLFNGDKLYHRVTPLGENEERIVLTLEYVTDIRMGMLKRFVSNMKDAIAYFGFRQVFRRHGN
ncbi:MAG: 2OG-Fe(II) oxygenase [Nostoc sp. ChiSLP02]|nr:2OG-Fe(II) oxygenase [Nostoc sp. DedSLP05]MDZ8100127.1 2OG-Fe(II) oxygenase [Nostoc sp. DedSLP01]MDZ8189923.1 2OG-Fe(II) oxygenase [Nostoc sp. ChiSLP02]